jgi:hypothetical protein
MHYALMFIKKKIILLLWFQVSVDDAQTVKVV